MNIKQDEQFKIYIYLTRIFKEYLTNFLFDEELRV